MVRSTLFDKTSGANRGVFWHQDLSIAVPNRADASGFSAWTRKAGVNCVQTPPELMRRMLAVRIHLDDCTRENGALRVLPGTHGHARLQATDVEELRQSTSETICEVPAGGLQLMRPLLLHASSPMQRARSRRVIHLEFTDFELPAPLAWRYRIPIQ